MKFSIPIAAAIHFAVWFPANAQESDSAERWKNFSKETIRELGRIRSPDLIAEKIRTFASEDYVESAQYLIRFLDDRHSPHLAQAAGAEVLGDYENLAAREAVKEAALRDAGQNHYLLRAYLRQRDPESGLWLLNLAAKAETPRGQAIAMDGLRELGKTESFSESYIATLKKWIEDEETFHGIRVSAAKTLGMIPTPESVDVLVAQLSDPLLREAARDGLTRLTGLDHWEDSAGWENWWKTNRDSYLPQPMNEAAFQKKIAALKEASVDFSMEFYGIKLTGKNIVFVLDSSGSMAFDDRMGRLKDELTTMIDQLHESYQFGLVLFPMASIPGRDFDNADDRFKKRAIDFVERMQAVGGTPMWDALDHTFERIVSKENIDTIYLLSDGVPTDLPPEEITDRLLGYCDTYGTTIHTVFIGDEDIGKKLMEDVAEMTGGRFAHVQ